MSQTQKVQVRPQKVDDEVWVACGNCGRVTRHDVLCAVDTSDDSPEGDIKVWNDYLTIQCGGCGTVSFCVSSSCSEDRFYNPQTEDEVLLVTHRVYPNRIAGRSELEHCQLLPHATYRVYQETRAAFCNNQPVLAGIGIRAIVETVCKERSAKGKDLEQKIDALAVAGVITKDGAEILHSLRFMGNEAAHEVKAHTEDELIIALDVAEYVLKGVYILPKIAGRLPKK